MKKNLLKCVLQEFKENHIICEGFLPNPKHPNGFVEKL